MSTAPRVDRLVLFKHGVAHVRRSGPVDGDFELTFRRSDMKDVLKSLTVAAPGGQAAVGTVGFDTPSDPRIELADRNLLLGPGAALLDLLESLRGRTVEVHCGQDQHVGEVIGVDDSGSRPSRRILVLRTEAGTINLVDLAQADQVELREDPSRENLAYLVEKSRAATAGQNCQVRVQIRGQADTAEVSYIVPAPMWRVSYRLVRDGDKLTLAAMGIVHNPLDEDLSEVNLTLTTGQPISFDIDLYHGKQVQRTVVEESVRRAAAPRAKGFDATGIQAVPAAAPMMAAGYGAAPGYGAFDGYADAVDDVDTADRGEYFEYRLTTPVSLQRGGAAMVPLAVSPVDDVRREVVWRVGSAPAPDITLAFNNSSGLVLEEGPAVVYEDGGYAGEAMLGFTARGAKVVLPFAKDLAVRCAHSVTQNSHTTKVRLGSDALVEESRWEQRHVLRAENDHDDAVDVIFELPRFDDHHVHPADGAVDVSATEPEPEPAGSVGAGPRSSGTTPLSEPAGSAGGGPRSSGTTPLSEPAGCHRFKVTVGGHQSVAATVVETWPIYSHVAYQDLTPGKLEQWVNSRALDAATMQALSGVLGRWAEANRIEAEQGRLGAMRTEEHAAQGRIAEQLQVLGTDGPEGDMRRRLVGELDASQNRIHQLDGQVRGLRDNADRLRRDASEELRRLIGDRT